MVLEALLDALSRWFQKPYWEPYPGGFRSLSGSLIKVVSEALLGALSRWFQKSCREPYRGGFQKPNWEP